MPSSERYELFIPPDCRTVRLIFRKDLSALWRLDWCSPKFEFSSFPKWGSGSGARTGMSSIYVCWSVRAITVLQWSDRCLDVTSISEAYF